mmetsp:Transcript_53609/g.120883  ORF Transcript_53609/g.120883 Transcript_53609/m.120883 type:complete len:174 (+) Transcript_53609:140-661(+)
MSSWQQAVSADLYKGKKRAVTVALSGNQQKNLRTGREDPDVAHWVCVACQSEMPGPYTRCDKCGTLRPDERASRLELRKKDGEIGRGGGYFQRSSTQDRKEWNSDDEGYDEFGRKKKKASEANSSSSKAATAEADPSRSAKEAMTEKQRAALARLRQRRCGGQRSRSRSPGPR